MSEVSDAAIVHLLLADYAVSDPQGKLNVTGGGLTWLGRNPATGLTVMFALVASVEVPPPYYGAEASIEILLEDSAGNLVTLPEPAPGLPQQPMRVGQVVRFEEPRFPPMAAVPSRYITGRWQWVLLFSTGLPLMEGQGYAWRVRIDNETQDDWTHKFVVLGQAQGPVIG